MNPFAPVCSQQAAPSALAGCASARLGLAGQAGGLRWRLARVSLAGPLALAALMSVLAGCSSRSLTTAPVEDRGTASRSAPPAAVSGVTRPPAPAPLAVAENAGKPGYYTVKPGDTLIRIGLDSGQNWRDISRWNAIDNPNQIEVGQVLRVTPPSDAVVTRPVTASAAPVPTPLPAQGAGPAKAASPQASASQPQAPAASASATAAPAPAPASADDEIAWLWPAQGASLAGFDEVKNKGLDIGGRAGDPVVAAADGRVVYSGAGLRGYGNLIILKHNNTYLTAYAHNQTLLVKEDQSVRKGQKIAEMGSSDADRVKLHFEIRRQGKPVDPAKYLPAR
jgi:lipoprotein NlpD